ncbi:Disease resistance protein RPP13-like protein [Drosera capensis]
MDSVVSHLIDTTCQLLQQEAKILLGVGDQVKALAAQLNLINAFLQASEGKRDEQKVVKELLRQILDVSLEAEDVLDDFMLAVEKQKRRNFVGKAIHGINHAARLTKVSLIIDGINTTIKRIFDDVTTYGIEIKDGSVGNSESELAAIVRRRRQDVEQEYVVGFKDVEAALLTKLVSGWSKLDFVSIVGEGGLGKTTIAKKMYNNRFVNEFFHRLAWVYVSEDYNTRDVILGIMKSVMPLTYKEELLAGLKVEELRDMLFKQLKGQRYLVVLDDIWKPEMWEEVKGCFPDADNQSRIMITSRKKEVAIAISPSSTYSLRRLTDDEGWELFSKKVFRGGSCPSDLVGTGKEIAKGCRGLPLSIVVMAGISAKDISYRRWSKLKDHVSSYLTEDKTSVEIVALSYHDLPRELKPCFLYFAAFPEDFEVPARQLMRLWISEGFIQPIGKLTLEDIAEDNLQKLIDRSLVQAGRSRADGGVKTCRIHDSLRELCITESKNEKFLETEIKIDSSKPKESNRRRISLHCSAPRFILSKSCDFSQIRSIQSFGSDDRKLMKAHWKAVSEGKLLRVLDFGTNIIEEVPDAAEELFLLKYLSINAPSLKVFPSSILNLWSLETLDMRATRLAVVPNGIYKLQKLRHLYLAGAVKLLEPRSKQLEDGWNIQTLSTVAPVEGTKTLVKRGLLASVTRLGLFGSNSSEWKDLESQWDVLSGISQLQNLQSLKLASEMGDVVIVRYLNPNVVPSGLTKMTLINTRIGSKSLEMLGNLPSLRILKLLEDSIQPGMDNFVFAECSFPQLRLLHMSKLKASLWDLKGGAVPHLQRLVMRDCSFWSIGAGVLLELDELKEIEITWPHPWFARMLKDIEANLKGDCQKLIHVDEIKSPKEKQFCMYMG